MCVCGSGFVGIVKEARLTHNIHEERHGLLNIVPRAISSLLTEHPYLENVVNFTPVPDKMCQPTSADT